MASGYTVAGLGDLDDVFQLGSRGAPNSGYQVGGSDLINRYAQWDGTGANQAPATGMGTPYGDLNIFFQKKTSAGIVNPISGGNFGAAWALFPDSAYSEYVLLTNGVVGVTNDTPGNWYSPATAGIGASYYAKFVHASGDAASGGSGAMGAWQLLNVNRYIYMNQAGVGTRLGGFNVYISTGASDATIVTSRSFSLQATVDI